MESMRKAPLLILILLFFASFTNESFEGVSQNSQASRTSKESKASANSGEYFSNAYHAEDCHNKDCSDHKNHCEHHCFGLHSFYVAQSNTSILSLPPAKTKNLWFSLSHYKDPLLDPSIKPPLPI